MAGALYPVCSCVVGTCHLKNKSMAKKIQTLEENQLSVRYDKDKEAIYFEKGVK